MNSLDMSPGLKGQITIQDPNNTTLYSLTINSLEDASVFINAYGRPMQWSSFKAEFVTMRIDSNHFAKALFIPACANSAIKLNDVAVGVIVLFIIDIITLPVRIGTLPFRAIYIKTHPHHISLLIGSQNYSQNDVVNIEIFLQSVTIDDENAERYFILATIPLIIKPTPGSPPNPTFVCKKQNLRQVPGINNSEAWAEIGHAQEGNPITWDAVLQDYQYYMNKFQSEESETSSSNSSSSRA